MNEDTEYLLGAIVITKDGDYYVASDKSDGTEMFRSKDRNTAQGVASCCIATINLLTPDIPAKFTETHIEWIGGAEEGANVS